MYVDILLTESDSVGLVETKYLRHHFVTKDMDKPKYFLGIEFAHQKHILLSQRKYALDLLEGRHTTFEYKLANTTIEANLNLWFDGSYTLDSKKYKRLIR